MSQAVVRSLPGAHMRSEIREQPSRWLDLLHIQEAALREAAGLLTDHTDSVVLVARGSSDHAAIYAQYLVAQVLGLPAWLATPSVASVVHRDVFTPRTLVVSVSQSGASPDLIATLESAHRCGARSVSFTNDPASPVAQLADAHVDITAGVERSVAATKSYTSELMSLQAWARLAAGHAFAAVLDDAGRAAQAAWDVIDCFGEPAQALADELSDADRMLFIGRGMSMATAKEAALKVIETCGVAASGWSAADAKHGPLGQVGPSTPVFLLAASAMGRDSVLALTADVNARGGRVIVVGRPGENSQTETYGAKFPTVEESLIPALEMIPLQLLALELALARGRDPDHPFGLSKVTRTL